MKLLRLFAIGFLLILLSNFSHAEELTIYTEEFPPFNFTENNKIVGVSTEVVEAVLKRAEIDYRLESNSWPRTYEKAKIKPNSLIYSISRRANREKLFKWIGVIVPSVHSVFALKERTDIKIEELSDLKKYEIGTTIIDARETYLVNKGFKVENFQRLSGSDAHLRNYRKLKAGRIDLWPMPDAVAYQIIKNAGDDPLKIIYKVFEFSEISKGGYYIAASLQTSDEVVNKIASTLEDFKKTQEYKAILEKWGL